MKVELFSKGGECEGVVSVPALAEVIDHGGLRYVWRGGRYERASSVPAEIVLVPGTVCA